MKIFASMADRPGLGCHREGDPFSAALGPPYIDDADLSRCSTRLPMAHQSVVSDMTTMFERPPIFCNQEQGQIAYISD